MKRISGWRRLLLLISVASGLGMLWYVSEAFTSPTNTLNTLYRLDMARLQHAVLQLKAENSNEETIKLAEAAIADRKTEYVKQLQKIPAIAISTFVATSIECAIFGSLVFLIGLFFEWVYRGFRPLPTAPTEAAPVPLVEASEGGEESPLALPHQAIQQSLSESPAPSQELQKREFLP